MDSEIGESMVAAPVATPLVREDNGAAPVVNMVAQPDAARSALAKRLLDLAIAMPLLVLLAPLMLVVAALVRLTSPGPALFRQVRIGRDEVPFTMLKFRTMRIGENDSLHREFNVRELRDEAAPSDGIYKPEHDPRLTAIGSFLRRFSIDELPQLLNVARGEMSLVGPRPALPWEVELFTSEQRHRHRCLPGMTGLWQVSGRNRLSMRQMLELDLHYCRHATLATDLAILLRTPKTVLLEQVTR